ncbi:helix-turn-helix domain-containing protein [Inquilinus limosus]|uniref:helix-turn-helix domain-containing protein n=1 Tax=Inquilinus limosus TaxID=171674 RepID=UPI000426EB18|nr:helix-turn-helix domain-containing protein [Inquilinus limosus]
MSARPQLDLLDPEIKGRFAGAEQRRLAKGDRTDWGERDCLHLVRSGWLAQFRTLTDGRRHILRFLMPGDLVGVSSQFSGSAPAPAVALTDTRVATAPVADLIDQSDAGLRQFCVILALENAQAHETLLSFGCLDADERLASMLLGLFERAAARDLVSDRGLRLPLTQQDLADALGISPVHTNRMVMKLQRAGLIRLKNEWLQILDGPGLEAIAKWPRPMAWTGRPDKAAEPLSRDIHLPARRGAAPKPARTTKRILVVEDDQFLALHLQAIIRSLGFEVIGPADSLERGLRLAEADDLDAAVLDVRLDRGQRVFPVVRTLQRRSIPFSFVTGYSDPEVERFHAPVIRKPVETGSVAAVIERLIH